MRFCKIGRAMTCTADYLERTAPKSQQKHRPVSAVISEHIGSQPFKLAQSSQIISSARMGDTAVYGIFLLREVVDIDP